jgi:hypothetical protein
MYPSQAETLLGRLIFRKSIMVETHSLLYPHFVFACIILFFQDLDVSASPASPRHLPRITLASALKMTHLSQG